MCSVVGARYTRGKKGIIHLSAIVKDIDNDDKSEWVRRNGYVTPDRFEERLVGLSYWHSTHSNTADSPKWRLVLPLSRPVTPAEYRRVHRGARLFLALEPGMFDPTCDQPERAYYAPSCPPEHAAAAFSGYVEGELWDVDMLLDLAGEEDPDPRQLTPEAITRAKSTNGDRPGDDFNRRATWGEAFTPDWTRERTRPDGTEDWNKPGHIGARSATVNYAGSDLCYCFSDSAGLPVGKGLNKHAVYTYLHHGGDFAAASRALRLAGYGGDSPAPATSSTGSAQEKPRVFTSARELLKKKIVLSFLIHKIIETNTIGYIYGPSGGGKTFVIMDMLCSIVTCRTWNGHKVKRGLVLYCCGEGHGGISRRLAAWQKHHDAHDDDLALFQVSNYTVSLNGEGLEDVITEARLLSEAHGAPVAAIVIDTLAKHMDGDENSTKDMGAFVRSLDAVRNAFPGSVAIAIHHTGHNQDRARGNYALYAGVEFEIGCNAGLLTFSKMKDAEKPEPMEFKLSPVEIGTDEEGEPITSCIVEWGERSARHQTAKLNPTERTAVKALIEVSAKHQERHGELFGALVADWRDAFYEARRNSDPEARQHALKVSFQRVQESLSDKAIIEEQGHHRYLTLPDYQLDIQALISSNNITAAHGTQTAHDGTM